GATPVKVALGDVRGGVTGRKSPPAGRQTKARWSPPAIAEPSDATAADRRSRDVPQAPGDGGHCDEGTPAAAFRMAVVGPTSAMRPARPTMMPCPSGPTATAFASDARVTFDAFPGSQPGIAILSQPVRR